MYFHSLAAKRIRKVHQRLAFLPVSKAPYRKLYHIMLYRVHLTWMGFKLTTLVVIGTDWTSTCSYKYICDTITTMMATPLIDIVRCVSSGWTSAMYIDNNSALTWHKNYIRMRLRIGENARVYRILCQVNALLLSLYCNH